MATLEVTNEQLRLIQQALEKEVFRLETSVKDQIRMSNQVLLKEENQNKQLNLILNILRHLQFQAVKAKNCYF